MSDRGMWLIKNGSATHRSKLCLNSLCAGCLLSHSINVYDVRPWQTVSSWSSGPHKLLLLWTVCVCVCVCVSCSGVSDSLRPHGLQPTRLLHPWNFPGKSTGVGCHCLPLLWTTYISTIFSIDDPTAAAAAAKSLQSCPTLCDPIDSSPSSSPVPGILQARTLEWVAISFSNAWRWKVKVKSLSPVRLLATPWTAAHQAPPSMGFSRQDYWSRVPLPSPDDPTTVLNILCSIYNYY